MTNAHVQRDPIAAAYLTDETRAVEQLLPLAQLEHDTLNRIEARARDLVARVRERGRERGVVQAFLHEYDLSTQEGVVLMCLAEALLRIPDAATADRLIQDKLAKADWENHLGHSSSLFVNASTWGLMLTGKLVKLDRLKSSAVGEVVKVMLARSGEPAIRVALKQAMHIIAQQFVMGRDIDGALMRSIEPGQRRYLHSFDMLGESALSAADAQRYFSAYQNAIKAVAGYVSDGATLFDAPGVSVKLSALHPRYDVAHRDQVMAELVPKVTELARLACAANINLTVDAEEAERLELSLEVFEQVFRQNELAGWNGLGLAVQAYQKRASHVVRYLAALAHERGRRIPVRLVKGAYWDTEIKRAQERGLDTYPVFTRKSTTDVSYLACARLLLERPDCFYPQFATHNARTVASVIEMAGASEYEFQKLHGMGDALYDVVLQETAHRCRVYAPVGSHQDLLPYLVRRLLENGANTSFVNRIEDEAVPMAQLIADPVARTQSLSIKPHPQIPSPREIFDARRGARGMNLQDAATLGDLAKKIADTAQGAWTAAPLIGGKSCMGATRGLRNPADQRMFIGTVAEASTHAVQDALRLAAQAAPEWDAVSAGERAKLLEHAAELLEENYSKLIALCVREGGKTIVDAHAEAREAVDYCRYYAQLARQDFSEPRVLPGPTGERNALSLHGRGVFACISPWNFPLAIFTGQIAAALAAGNAVVAKPAGQTPLTAMLAVRLLHRAGIPENALQFLPGSGRDIGDALLGDARVGGVAFTGSTEVARHIQRVLAQRDGAIVPLIAETGGQNVLIVDSSALPEQVVVDALQSAFNSAGQRCSALRVMFVQDDIAPRVIELLQAAMGELVIGDPASPVTDVGPVIDIAAREALEQHAQRMRADGRELRCLQLPPGTEHGLFFAPRAYEIESLSVLQREVFGPVLHVVRYAANKLDEVIAAVNATGYGLTLGIHSRIDATVDYITARARVGNVYVNRNMIGAVVGVQPFGGEGLSGTGPKAGGPFYLHRFATERTLTVNTAAVGGNTTLVGLSEDEAR